MLKKRFTSLFLALAMVLGLSGQAFAANVVQDENAEGYNTNLNSFVEGMFEKDGYRILQNGTVDVSEKFYEDTQESYERGDFKAILDYMRENKISAYAPTKVTPIEVPTTYSTNDVTGAKWMHDEQLIYVEDKEMAEDNLIQCILDAVVGYNETKRTIISVGKPNMQYQIGYHYDLNCERYYPDDDDTGCSYTSQRANYWYGADIFVNLIDDGSGFVIKYHFRVDSTRTFTVNEVLNA